MSEQLPKEPGVTLIDKQTNQRGRVLSYLPPKEKGWFIFEIWTLRLEDGSTVQREAKDLERP